MADATTKPRRRARKREHDEDESQSGAQDAVGAATDKVEGAAGGATGKVEDAAGTAHEQAQGAAGTATGALGAARPTLVSELKDTVREAALEVLRPVAREAATSAAAFAATKGPGLVKDKVAPKVAEAGGAGALAKGALSKGSGVAGDVVGKIGNLRGDGKRPPGHGRGRRLPVQEYVDVAVDLETAYDQWTQFEEFPSFMHRVERVEQRDDTTLMWHENIWGVRRSWEAEIIEQTPSERIVWRSKSGPQQTGVVTFHRLSDRLTRVQVNLDFQPQGLFEKTASGFRMARRALRSDLMRFKAFMEMRDEPTGAWRGRIEEGEVVEGGGDGRKPEEEEPEAEEEEPEAEAEEEEPEAEEEPTGEAEDYEDEDEYDEEEEEEEPEEEPKKPIRRRRASTRATSRRRRG
jgi:uncharacterized membrane protein